MVSPEQNFEIGAEVIVQSKSGTHHVVEVRWKGIVDETIHKSRPFMVGIEYRQPIGKHAGRGYFHTKPNHASFVFPKQLIPIFKPQVMQRSFSTRSLNVSSACSEKSLPKSEDSKTTKEKGKTENKPTKNTEKETKSKIPTASKLLKPALKSFPSFRLRSNSAVKSILKPKRPNAESKIAQSSEKKISKREPMKATHDISKTKEIVEKMREELTKTQSVQKDDEARARKERRMSREASQERLGMRTRRSMSMSDIEVKPAKRPNTPMKNSSKGTVVEKGTPAGKSRGIENDMNQLNLSTRTTMSAKRAIYDSKLFTKDGKYKESDGSIPFGRNTPRKRIVRAKPAVSTRDPLKPK